MSQRDSKRGCRMRKGLVIEKQRMRKHFASLPPSGLEAELQSDLSCRRRQELDGGRRIQLEKCSTFPFAGKWNRQAASPERTHSNAQWRFHTRKVRKQADEPAESETNLSNLIRKLIIENKLHLWTSLLFICSFLRLDKLLFLTEQTLISALLLSCDGVKIDVDSSGRPRPVASRLVKSLKRIYRSSQRNFSAGPGEWYNG